MIVRYMILSHEYLYGGSRQIYVVEEAGEIDMEDNKALDEVYRKTTNFYSIQPKQGGYSLYLFKKDQFMYSPEEWDKILRTPHG